MSKTQFILLTVIVGSYSLLFVTLAVKACIGCWQARRYTVAPKIEKISHVVRGVRHRAWTRAVWRGTLVHEAR